MSHAVINTILFSEYADEGLCTVHEPEKDDTIFCIRNPMSWARYRVCHKKMVFRNQLRLTNSKYFEAYWYWVGS